MIIWQGLRSDGVEKVEDIAYEYLLEHGIYFSIKVITVEQYNELKVKKVFFYTTLKKKVFLLPKALIDDYLKNSKEKLDAAKLLFNNKFYNDSVSRSYYSMFWTAKALLLVKGLNVETHKSLITRFGLDFVKKGFIEKLMVKLYLLQKRTGNQLTMK